MAIFALQGRAHFAAKVMHDEVQPVADAEDGDAGLEEGWVGDRRVMVVDARRAAGENDADGLQSLDFGDRGGAGKYDGEDVELTNAAGNELGILRPEIEDYDCLGVHILVWQGAGGDVKKRALWNIGMRYDGADLGVRKHERHEDKCEVGRTQNARVAGNSGKGGCCASED